MLRACGRELGDVADRHPPAIAEALGQVTDLIEIEIVRALAEVEVHVDIDIELAGEREHAVDLPGGVAVGIGRGTDDTGSAFQRLHHELVGARVVEQPLLREDANLEVDRPAIGVDQRQHALEAAHADAGIDLQMGAHVGRALCDAGVEHAACTRIYVLSREFPFDPRHLVDGLGEIASLRAAAVEDAGLVEMDVGLDEPGRHQTAAHVEHGRVCLDLSARSRQFGHRRCRYRVWCRRRRQRPRRAGCDPSLRPLVRGP